MFKNLGTWLGLESGLNAQENQSVVDLNEDKIQEVNKQTAVDDEQTTDARDTPSQLNKGFSGKSTFLHIC